MPIKVLIADDDVLIREGLKILIQLDERFEVTACVENGLQAVEYCTREPVDVALLDVRMPVMTGLQAAREISARTAAKPLILTTFDDDNLIFDAVKSDVRGYLLKNSTPDRIKDAIKLVYEGGTVMQDVVMEKIKEGLVSQRPGKIDETLFSERELEVIRLVAKGLSNKEIAGQLYMSEGTVKNHVTSILGKTGLEHRTQIAIYYLTGSKG